MFEERPRKVHFHHDQQGATFGLKKTPFSNTLCKINSAVPESHITTDPDKVTCKICRKDHRFAVLARKRNINEMYGKMASAYPPDLMPHLQMCGRARRPTVREKYDESIRFLEQTYEYHAEDIKRYVAYLKMRIRTAEDSQHAAEQSCLRHHQMGQ